MVRCPCCGRMVLALQVVTVSSDVVMLFCRWCGGRWVQQ